jgi:enoyl-CoA hydratase/carnithine racemase
MTEHVKTEIDAGIMTLTLARADKKNALSNAMYSAMSNGLERAEKDPAVRVVLFQGDGDSFTAGNDLAGFSAQANGKDTGEPQAQAGCKGWISTPWWWSARNASRMWVPKMPALTNANNATTIFIDPS